MRKYLKIFLIILVVLLSGTSCTSKSDVELLEKAHLIKIYTENLSYKIPIESIHFTMINNSDDVIEFGTSYSLQRNTDNGWVDIPYKKDVAWTTILLKLSKNQKYEADIHLNIFDYKFGVGEYRVVKYFSTKDKKTLNVNSSFALSN